MALTEEQAKKIKEHLFKQLENFPEEKREQIKQQIESLTLPQLEEFIKQNNLTHLESQCVFCSIAQEKVPSYKIAENQENLAVLNINPISKGNILVIPKAHTKELLPSTKDLGDYLIGLVKERLHPNEVKSQKVDFQGHSALEIIPIYGDEKERKPASEEELASVRGELLKPKEEEKKVEEKTEEIPKFKPRIP